MTKIPVFTFQETPTLTLTFHQNGCTIRNHDSWKRWWWALSVGVPWNGKQEGWLSPTERASVSAISLRHILAFPGYAPGTIAVNVTRMKRGFSACQTHRRMYPSIFNRFPVIQPASSKVRHFSTFFAHFGITWVRPLDNRRKCYMGGKRIQCWSTHSSIYPSIFNRLRAITARYWSEIATFSCTPLHLTPSLGCSHWNSGSKKFGPQKTRIMGLPDSEDSLTIGWAVSIQYQRVTDRETDRHPTYINNVRSMTDAR